MLNITRIALLRCNLYELIYINFFIQPQKRLGSANEGAEEIKTHPFFKDIDWSFVIAKAYEPPFKPKFTSTNDLNYFDRVIVFFLL